MVYLCSRPLTRSTSSRLVEHDNTPPCEGSNGPSRNREDSNKLPLIPSSPRLRPIGDWRRSLPAVRAAFPISSSAPSQTPARVMTPRLPPSPLCAESVAFAIDVEASAPQPGGTRWDGRMSIPCVAGVPASSTRTTVGEEARTRRVASFHCLTSIPPSTTIESLRLYRAVAKVLTERATRHDAACPPQAGIGAKGPVPQWIVDGTFVTTPRWWTAGPDSPMQRTAENPGSPMSFGRNNKTRSNDGCPRGLKWRWYDATRGLGGGGGLPVFTRAVARRAWRGNYNWEKGKRGLAVVEFAAGGL